MSRQLWAGRPVEKMSHWFQSKMASIVCPGWCDSELAKAVCLLEARQAQQGYVPAVQVGLKNRQAGEKAPSEQNQKMKLVNCSPLS